MIITVFCSFLKITHLLNYRDDDPAFIFYNHIVTSYMIAFAAYLSCLLLLNQIKVKPRPILYSSLFVLFSYHELCINTGRTGMIIYFILILLAFLQCFPLKKTIILSTFFIVSFVVIYHFTNNLSDQFSSSNPNLHRSLSLRMQFHHYAKEIFMTHPWLGHGTGSFSVLFERDNPVPSFGLQLLEPHSQYWLVLDEQGLIGAAALLFVFISLYQSTKHLTEMKAVFRGTLIPFIIVNASDTLITYSALSYLFITFSALCLAS